VWHDLDRAWALHDPTFEAEGLDPEHAAGPWHGHRWFAYDLLRFRTPDLVVELGAHYGVSFFALLQAIKDAQLATVAVAVDTWEGDPHAGLYGPEVLERFEGVRSAAFSSVEVVVKQATFAAALGDFDDESVDLIHIDGYHSYEAAKEDFETWLPKLAPGGVVLMHDVAPDTGYGSADYWGEVEERYPAFAFPHSFGLGVALPKGTEGFEYLFSPEFVRWRSYYTRRAQSYLFGLQARTQATMIDARDETIKSQEEMIVDRDSAIKAQAVLIDERDALLRSYEREREEAAHDDGASPPSTAVDEEAAEPPVPSAGAVPVLGPGGARPPARGLRGAVRRGLRFGESFARRLRDRSHGSHGGDDERRAVFDPDWYLRRYPDVAKSGRDPFRHYVNHGAGEGRDPSPLFSASWYLTRYPDVAAAGLDPLTHYLRYGAEEGRDPSPIFDAKFYRRHTPDLDGTGENPLLHYLSTGIGEGRFVGPEHRRRVMERHVTPLSVADAEVERIRAVAVHAPDTATQVVPTAALSRIPARLVTLDVWDTIIVRTRPADSAKLATARRQWLRLGNRLPASIQSPWDLFDLRVAAEADIAASRSHEEYTIEEALHAVYRFVLPDAADADVAEMVALDARTEWDDEIAATQPVREIWAMLTALFKRDDAPQVALVSDFYVGADRIRLLLDAHGWPWPDSPIFVSCEEHASKRLDGSLFRLVREHFGVDASEHLHIGDNAHSDGTMQVATGGRSAVLQLSPRALPGPGALTGDSLVACWAVLRRQLHDLAEVHAQFRAEGDHASRALWAGISSAPLAVAVVARAIEVARVKGIDRIHYLSREGQFLAQVHQVVAPVLMSGAGEPPQAVHLEVSRRATFGASLADASHEQMQRMWRMYGAQSPRALLVSLGAEVEDFTPFLSRHGLAIDTAIGDIARNKQVQAFLEDPAVSEKLAEVLAARREQLLGYFAQETDLDAPELIVVDVGWRGSIQDNLAHVLSHTQIHGVYLGLFPFLNDQPPNVVKEAVGFNANVGEEYAFAEPPAAVERPWTPHVPSTIGYRLEGGRYLAVHDIETSASPAIATFQRGVLDGAVAVAEFLVGFGFSIPMVHEMVQAELRQYYERPWGGAADLWFGSDHDDTFGALNVTPFGKNKPNQAWLGSGAASLRARAAADSRWETGFDAWLPVMAAHELRRMLEETR
jgi:FMN phosphatase YigB (HAD superfamily)